MKATIDEIGEAGSLDVTVSRIARRAGMSSALAHHYFGGKEQILLAAMRHILREYSSEVRRALAGAEGPQARLEAIIRANFAASYFDPATVSAWMSFYVQAQHSGDAARLLRVYQRRLHSNLVHALRPLCAAPVHVAETLAALIDGVYIRAALNGKGLERGAVEMVAETAAALIGETK